MKVVCLLLVVHTIQGDIQQGLQKIKGILNVFVVYMIIPITITTCEITATNKRHAKFLDFIKRVVDQKYDRNIKKIFLVLDNIY